jgi:hypothetical protein
MEARRKYRKQKKWRQEEIKEESGMEARGIFRKREELRGKDGGKEEYRK